MDARRSLEHDHLREKLNEKGRRLTGQRQAILDVMLENTERHLSSEEIYNLVSRKHPGIGLSTVYRTLPLLEKMGMLCRIELDDGYIRYETCGTERLAHHHLICTRCGSIIEVQEDLLKVLEEKVLENNGFKVYGQSVKLYGCCSACRGKR